MIDHKAILANPQLIYCLDVWEDEPNLNLDLVNLCTIATPHIAGYSLEGKYKASLMVFKKAQQFFNWTLSKDFTLKSFLIPQKIKILENSWEEILLKIYNPLSDTEEMKRVFNKRPQDIGQYFDELRNNFTLRRELSSYVLMHDSLNIKITQMLIDLGLTLIK